MIITKFNNSSNKLNGKHNISLRLNRNIAFRYYNQIYFLLPNIPHVYIYNTKRYDYIYFLTTKSVNKF